MAEDISALDKHPGNAFIDINKTAEMLQRFERCALENQSRI